MVTMIVRREAADAERPPTPVLEQLTGWAAPLAAQVRDYVLAELEARVAHVTRFLPDDGDYEVQIAAEPVAPFFSVRVQKK